MCLNIDCLWLCSICQISVTRRHIWLFFRKSVWGYLFVFTCVRCVSALTSAMLASFLPWLRFKFRWKNEFLIIYILLRHRKVALWGDVIVKHENIWYLLSYCLEIFFWLLLFGNNWFWRRFTGADSCFFRLLHRLSLFSIIISINYGYASTCWGYNVHLVLYWIPSLHLFLNFFHICVLFDRFSKPWTVWLKFSCLTLFNLELIEKLLCTILN